MPHILVVEDELGMAKTLDKGLQKAGYQVTIINHGLMARVADLSDIDLVILDWMLPGMSGVDILREWQRKKVQTPILMLTAKGETADKVMGLNFGADDYLSKFFEWDELLARIEALLRRVSKSQTKVGPITFDRQAISFAEDGLPVHLTTTEYNILKYFFDNPRKLITRQNLVSAVYDHAENPFSNVIERHIKQIRKKFNYDPITTIHGFGYRLKTESPLPSNQS